MPAIFRLLDVTRGTLVYDEADFNKSDESNLMTKLLNVGHEQGASILRCESSSSHEWDPTAFNVFGPKLIATRQMFDDAALESRCLTERMDGLYREGIPYNLPDSFRCEANAIRNKLLLYRFRKYYEIHSTEPLPNKSTVHPRLQQIIQPLIAVADNDSVVADLLSLVENQDSRLIGERQDSRAAIVLEAILNLVLDHADEPLSYGLILEEICKRPEGRNLNLTAQEIGLINTKHLSIPKKRCANGMVLRTDLLDGKARLKYLRQKYHLA